MLEIDIVIRLQKKKKTRTTKKAEHEKNQIRGMSQENHNSNYNR